MGNEDYILVCDNDRTGHELFELLLDKYNFKCPVFLVNGGYEALEFIERHKGECKLLLTSQMKPTINMESITDCLLNETNPRLKAVKLTNAKKNFLSGSQLIIKVVQEGMNIRNAVLTSAFDLDHVVQEAMKLFSELRKMNFEFIEKGKIMDQFEDVLLRFNIEASRHSA